MKARDREIVRTDVNHGMILTLWIIISGETAKPPAYPSESTQTTMPSALSTLFHHTTTKCSRTIGNNRSHRIQWIPRACYTLGKKQHNCECRENDQCENQELFHIDVF